MKLSAEQIEELFLFTHKKRVPWYDLQVELVDHMATRIEEMMTVDKKISFDRALQKVYDEFGIFGFAKVVQHAEESLRKKNQVIWWRAFVQQFTWPNLVRSICLILAVFIVCALTHVAAVAAGLFLFQWFHDIKHNKLMKKRNKTAKKLLLLQSIQYLQMGSWFIFNFFVCNTSYIEVTLLSPGFYFWTFICFLLLINYLVTSNLRNKLVHNAESLYPEAFTPSEA